MKTDFDVKYELGHTYHFFYETTDYYCPNCGQQKIWVEDSEGDYYEGATHYCVVCEYSFTMSRLSKVESFTEKQIIEKLKSAKFST